jgi:CRISPR-associated endoribonuclease Cas6
MYTVTYIFTPLHEPLNGRYIYAKSLHGFLFNITGQADRQESDWLHGSGSPRPFALVPLYGDDGILAGIRISAITERAATLFQRTGEWFCKTKRPCHLNGHEFIITDCRITSGLNWQQLAHSQPAKMMGLRFASPTAFKQGPGWMLFPLPGNVFGSAVRLWETYAPPMMTLPRGWLDWCKKDVFVVQHNIETVQVNISQKALFTGFVGEVWYTAQAGDEMQLRAWQALGNLAAFFGVGHKATMGMGAVDQLS